MCINFLYEVEMKFIFFLGCSLGFLCVLNGELVILILNFNWVYCFLVIFLILKNFEFLEILYIM